MSSEYDKFIHIDERGDLVHTLGFLESISQTLNSNPLNWKWCIIVMHNALQGALVCTLAGSAGFGILRNDSQKKTISWYEASRDDQSLPRPREYLADLMTLYGRAQDPNFSSEFGGTALITSCLQDEDVERLCNLRNGFQHFTPKGWSIERVGLPRIMSSALSVIADLLNHPANTYRFNRQQSESVQSSIDRLRNIFGAMPTSV